MKCPMSRCNYHIPTVVANLARPRPRLPRRRALMRIQFSSLRVSLYRLTQSKDVTFSGQSSDCIGYPVATGDHRQQHDAYQRPTFHSAKGK